MCPITEGCIVNLTLVGNVECVGVPESPPYTLPNRRSPSHDR